MENTLVCVLLNVYYLSNEDNNMQFRIIKDESGLIAIQEYSTTTRKKYLFFGPKVVKSEWFHYGARYIEGVAFPRWFKTVEEAEEYLTDTLDGSPVVLRQYVTEPAECHIARLVDNLQPIV